MATVVDEIKSRVDIVDLVSQTVQLRRSGKNYTGFCPFHSNTRTPAFVVFPESGTWRCFGQCNEGGDIFGFMMKKEGWDFSEALRYLADRAGVALTPHTPEEQAKSEEFESMRNVLEEAAGFYRHNLFHTPAGQAVLDYLQKVRGLNIEIIEAFGLGFAPDSWDAGLEYLSSKGWSETDLLGCGLIMEREGGAGYYDRFRNRLMLPIRDERGRLAGFGARVVNPDDVPKFLNSPQNPLFDKGRLLYGLDRARKGIRERDQAVLVEGYLDVIALHQAGFTNVVSPMGTALTEGQLRLLKRFSRRMVLALDADAAGDRATLRGLEIARQSLDREPDPVFDSRGLLTIESRLQADIRVATLPPGQDPDEVIARSPGDWEAIIAGARPIVVHVMETLAKDLDLEDPKAKSRLAAQVLPLVEDVSDPIERDAYRQRLARLLRVDERVLLDWSPRTAGGARSGSRVRRGPESPRFEARTKPGDRAEVSSPDPVETHCLAVLLRRPDLVFRVDRALQEDGLNRLSVDDFHSTEHKLLLQLIEESLNQDHAEPLHYVLNSLSMPLMELADHLLEKSSDLDPNDDRVLEDLVRSFLLLRQRRLRQEIDHLRFLMEEAQAAGDSQAGEYQHTMVQYAIARSRLDQALAHYTSHTDFKTKTSLFSKPATWGGE